MGVDRVAGLQPAVELGVHFVEVFRGGAGFLSEVEAATEFHDAFVEFVEECAKAGFDGEVHADVPAGHREGQGGLIAFAEQLEHVEGRVVAAALDIADDFLEGFHCFARDDELVLEEALGAVAAVPFTNEVEGLIELREVLHLVFVSAGL